MLRGVECAFIVAYFCGGFGDVAAPADFLSDMHDHIVHHHLVSSMV